ncbi:Ig-like domain-containing protein [Emticicia sp. 21SJ11W-3]|uniref:Ig-like domain-containing protein n=1 Tax=Emticicia sp. 21SJ11W-3 TaxID=2916755 RepID=UPI0020A1CCF7|nr:Ig-like domain-containing protein [Emticicia sp. 21SJ11W-3]UTA66698.1 Ig-like domain-containing protein [Emticicia sp. 21SJ11W-3]
MKKLTILFIGLCLAACSKEDPMTINQPNGQLKYDGTHQFTVKKGGNSVSGITWKSSDTNVGTVDNTGKFKARKIGKTEVSAATKDGTVKASVEILPYSKLYTEPVLDFGQTKATVKAKEKRKVILDDGDLLAYQGENSSIELVLYVFVSNKLEVCGPVLQESSAVVKEAGTFLKERYPNNGVVNGEIVFLDDSKKYGIILGYDEQYGPTAIYAANTPGGRKALTPKQTESFKKALAAFKARR